MRNFCFPSCCQCQCPSETSPGPGWCSYSLVRRISAGPGGVSPTTILPKARTTSPCPSRYLVIFFFFFPCPVLSFGLFLSPVRCAVAGGATRELGLILSCPSTILFLLARLKLFCPCLPAMRMCSESCCPSVHWWITHEHV